MSVLVKQNGSSLQYYDGNQGHLVPANIGMSASISEELRLHDILDILKRRKWAIILPLILAVGAAVLYTLSTPASYRANAMIQIEKEGVQIIDFGSISKKSDAFGSDKDPFFRTRYEMLKSRILSQKVIDELGLKNRYLAKQKASAGFVEKKANTDYNQRFLSNLHILPVEGTHLVKVIYEAPSAEEAKEIVTSVINNFIKIQIESKSETGEYAKDFLGKQLVEARERLKASEVALVKYSNEKGILGIDDKQTRHVKKLENLDAALVQAEIRRIEAESLYQEMKRAGSVSTVLTNPVVANLKARLVQLEGDYQEMLKTFKPNYPDMVRLQQQVNNVRGQLNKEMGTIQRSMEADYFASKRQEDKIRKELSQFNKKMYNLQDNSIDYNTLKREVATNGKLYNSLLQRLEEVSVASAINTSNISIVEPAFAPISRYRPKPKLNLLLGLFSGLLIGLGLAFLREALDQSIKSSEELEKISGLPVLGMIPRITKPSIKKNLSTITIKAPQTSTAEAYRISSTNIRFMVDPQDKHVLLVTSARPKEGKSTTASNIASSYAKMGMKVLLVDADIRNSSLHSNLNLSNKYGLSHYLKGEVDLVGITQPVKAISGLYAITAGDYNPDPISLLSHERMSYLTTQGASIFDYVIIDAPPVEGFADTLILSSLATATIIVAKENSLESRRIHHVLKQLARVKNNVLGFLLVDVKKTNFNTKYYSKYHGKAGKKAALLANKKSSYA